MKRREFIKALGGGAVSFVACGCPRAKAFAQAAPKHKPNFVFIFIDDMGYRDLGCMGSEYYETPNIDKLAAEGVVFTNAYSNAPNCAPTRACLMSGQYGPRHGVYTVGTPERGPAKLRKLIPVPNTTELDRQVVTIPEALESAGYTSGCFGKWHLGNDEPHRPADQGFDASYQRTKRSHWTDAGQYLTDRLTNEAVDFIDANKDKPFFLYLSHHAVHTPIQAKPEIIDKYEDKAPANGHNNPAYAAMIESVDRSVARVLAKLEDAGLNEDTVVFFFSDNGGHANFTSMHPLRGSKGTLYEGGIRVPCIVRWSGRTKPGLVTDAPIIGIDFYPTMIELACADPPKNHVLDGCSIVDLLDPDLPAFASTYRRFQNRPIFWHFPAYLEPYNKSQWPWRTTPAGVVRKGPWKLIEFFEGHALELYNLDMDISEKNNLAAQMADKTAELHKLMQQWRKDIDAPVPTRLNPKYDPEARAAKPL